MTYIVLIGGLLLLLLSGMPIGAAMLFLAIGGTYLFLGGADMLLQIALSAYKSLDKYVLIALPLYILMGEIFIAGQTSNRLFDFAAAWLRHLRAGIGMAVTVSCGFFAAISGSSMTTSATIGRIAIPEMRSRGYSKSVSYGLVAGGGTLGILIPPSLAMILYSALTDESVGKLFLAGIIPGLLEIALIIIFLLFFTGEKLPSETPASWRERFVALRQAGWALFLPVVVLGGIYSGLFTPTEAAAVGALYTVFINMVIYRTMNWSGLLRAGFKAMETSAKLLFIVVGASTLSHVLIALRLPQQLTQFVTDLDMPTWMIFIAINLILILMGCFLDAMSVMLISIPILFPAIMALGFDPIWFAVILVMNMELAVITPPIGINIFAIQGIAHEELSTFEAYRSIVPFAIISLICILTVALVPGIATWLPSLLR